MGSRSPWEGAILGKEALIVKTAEPIETPFWMLSPVDPWNQMRVQIPTGRGRA